jgi:hypothetical protein
MFGASVAAIAASGCWNLAGDCEAMKSCRENPDEPQDDGGTPLDAPTDAPLPDCEPSPSEDGSVLRDECGIFVIPGVEGGDGTSTDPVGTLGTALALASSRDLKRVYVCEGDLSEEVNVPPGIEIYGGLACEDEWKTGEAKTSLTAPAGQVPLRLSEGDGSGPTRIEGFEVTAEMGVTPWCRRYRGLHRNAAWWCVDRQHVRCDRRRGRKREHCLRRSREGWPIWEAAE